MVNYIYYVQEYVLQGPSTLHVSLAWDLTLLCTDFKVPTVQRRKSCQTIVAVGRVEWRREEEGGRDRSRSLCFSRATTE